MKRTILSLSLCAAFIMANAQAVIEREVQADEVEDVTAESLGAIQVSNNDAFEADDREMMKTINTYMEEAGDNTDDYYAIIDEENSTAEEIQVKMYHNTAFPIMTQGAKKGIVLKGNPGGQCKTIYYNPKANEVIKQWWWD